MEMSLELPDCQIKPASSEQSYMLFHLHSLFRRSKEKNFIIFSDSMSSLDAISGFKLEIDIVQNIIKDYTHLANTGTTIILCWIPSHVNIRGNERIYTVSQKRCHPNHGYNFVNFWCICKILSLLQRTVNFQQN